VRVRLNVLNLDGFPIFMHNIIGFDKTSISASIKKDKIQKMTLAVYNNSE
jgi:hypothetical protein